jgi:hypothetical protein
VTAGEDPLMTWRAARAATVAMLTEQALARPTSIVGIGQVPLAAVVTLLITDHVAHTWDIGHALGTDVRLDRELLVVAFDWARANVVRRAGFFGPELTPPADADEQTRMLAFLGRAAWQPVPAWTGSVWEGLRGPHPDRLVQSCGAGSWRLNGVALVVLAVRDPADAGHGLDILAGAAEFVDALGRGVDVVGGDVDPRVSEAVLAGRDRAGGAVVDHVVVAAEFADTPAEQAAVEGACLGRVGGG